jgi:DNA-binding MarR family transcriptional regulator
MHMNEIGLVELLWNVNKKIGKRLAPLVDAEGLSMSEIMLLWKTHHAGSRRVTALAEELGVPPSTLTGMLDRLVDGGWLERDRDPDDRRGVVMKGTEKLNELIRNIRHASSRIMEKVMRDLPPSTKDRLASDLASVLECLEQEEREK